jgi:hypothetical protein
MILGMSTATYTFLHTLISLIGIGSGLIVAYGFLTHRRFERITAVFLITTALTSITGFGFPSNTSCRPTRSALSRWSCWPSPFLRSTYFTSPALGAGSMWSRHQQRFT